MKFTGADAIWLFFECSMLWFAIKFSIDASYVIRDRQTDGQGRTLWFYRKTDGLPVAAKNRTQALVLTVGVAGIAYFLSLPPLVVLFIRYTR
jgi:hypothetical protein